MKLLPFLALAIVLACTMPSHAQTAEGNCNTVTLTSVGIPYQHNLYFTAANGCGFFNVSACEAWINYCQPAEEEYLLQRQNGSTWTSVTQWQNSRTFDNLAHGTYRVAIRVPEPLRRTGCVNGRAQVYNTLGQVIGFIGRWSNTLAYSNSVVVGATVPADITWNFVDPNSNNLFNPGEQIVMNTTGTKNYDHWWVAIFENGGQRRYWSNGWTSGPIPNDEINLTALASSLVPFAGIPTSYTVQFAISAKCNTQWTNLDRGFIVCPSGFGCRIAAPESASDEGETLLIAHASGNRFSILNLKEKDADRLLVTLAGVDGRTLKTYEDVEKGEFDISDLNNGIYIVNVWNAGTRIYTSKLIVRR